MAHVDRANYVKYKPDAYDDSPQYVAISLHYVVVAAVECRQTHWTWRNHKCSSYGQYSDAYEGIYVLMVILARICIRASPPLPSSGSKSP